MTQPTWPAMWSAIQAAIQTASGLTAIWKFQDTPQPALDYVALSLGAAITVGIDYLDERAVDDWEGSTTYVVGDRVVNDSEKGYVCTQAGTSASSGGPTGTGTGIVDGGCLWNYVATTQGIAITTVGVREVPLTIEVYSAATVEQTAKTTALATLDQIVTKLRLPAARNAFAAVGWTPFDPGAANYLPTIVAAGFRGRATCDVRCRMPARALVEYADFISRVEVEATAENPDYTDIVTTVTTS